MAGRPQRFELRLTTQERVRLEKLIASSETASRLRQRARVILLRADGKTYADIEKELAISTPTIAKILKKCFAYGVDEALGDLDRTGRNDVIDAGAKAWLVSLACQFPEDVPEGPEQDRWTISALTDYVQRHCAAAGYASLENVRSSTVWNILNDPTAKPRHLDYCVECRDESPLEDKKQILLLYKRMELVPKFERDALGTGFCAVEPEGAAYSAVMQAVTLASVPIRNRRDRVRQAMSAFPYLPEPICRPAASLALCARTTRATRLWNFSSRPIGATRSAMTSCLCSKSAGSIAPRKCLNIWQVAAKDAFTLCASTKTPSGSIWSNVS